MENHVALLDLTTVRAAYQQDEQQARTIIWQMYYRGIAIMLLCDDQKSPEITISIGASTKRKFSRRDDRASNGNGLRRDR